MTTKAWVGTTLVDGRLVDGMVVVVDDGLITAVVPSSQFTQRPDVEVTSTPPGAVIAPGFIDLHIHGSGGATAERDVMDMARHVVSAGCTYFLPTLITQDLEGMLASIIQIRAAVGQHPLAATIGGVHLEGPFLNPRYGAQQDRFVLPPSEEVVDGLLEAADGSVRMVTIAPETPGAIGAIRRFVDAGAVASIGHTDATKADYMEARRAGASHATHLYNAMPSTDRARGAAYVGVRHPGVDDFVLADPEITCDIVVDSTGAHVDPVLVDIAMTCLPGRLALITDAMSAAGCPPGRHQRGDGEVVVTTAGEDVARREDGLLSGSAMMMHQALANAWRTSKAQLAEVLTMASTVPASVLGIGDRKGQLAAGFDADLVVIDPSSGDSVTVREVVVAGTTVATSQ